MRPREIIDRHRSETEGMGVGGNKPPSLGAMAVAAAEKAWNELPVLGEGHATAMLRQGFKELTHGLLPAFPQHGHVVEEPGLLGNPTQGEVAKARDENLVLDANQEPARVHSSPATTSEQWQALRAQQTAKASVHGQDQQQNGVPWVRQAEAQRQQTQERGGREM
jgi:hypothetical protein